MAIQNLRSSSAHKRPIAEVLSAGQIAINTNQASPGLFFKDSNGDLVKVGPVHIGTSAPNSSPATTAADALVSGTVYQILTLGTTDFTAVGASANTVGVVFTATGAGTGTGTVSGQQGNEKGEQWLDTTGGTYVLKIYDGSAWRSESGTFVDVSGDNMTGNLTLGTDKIVLNATSGAGTFANEIKVEGSSTPSGLYSGISRFGSLLIGTSSEAVGNARLAIDSGNGNITSVGSATFAGRVTAGVLNSTPLMIAGTADKGGYTTVFTIRDSGNNNLFGIEANGDITSVGSAYFASNVGIGTTSPEEILHVAAASEAVNSRDGVMFQSTSSLAADTGLPLVFTSHIGNVANYGVASIAGRKENATSGNAAGYLQFATGSSGGAISEKMRIDSSGNIGIGTTSATSLGSGFKEVIVSGATEGAGLQLQDTDGNVKAGLFTSDNSGAAFIRTITNHPLVFRTNNTERMLIDTSGNIGVGTSSPTTANAGGRIIHIHNPATTGTKPAEIVFTNGTTGTTGGSGGTVTYYENSLYMWNYEAQSLIFGTNALHRMRIDSSGRLLVGTTSGSGEPIAAFQGRSNNASDSGIVAITRTGTNPSGSIGELRFATGSDFNKYYGMILCQSDGTTSSTSLPGALRFSTTASGSTAPTERMRINNQGDHFTFGVTNNVLARVGSSGTGGWIYWGAYGATNISSGTQSFGVYANGDVVNDGNNYGPLNSDERLKQDITDANSQWDDIKNIRITNFHYKNDPTGHLHIGPIAQELEQVSPGLVTRRPVSKEEIADSSNDLIDGDEVLSFKASILYMKAVKALQEAMERIETLEAKVAVLEAG